MTTHRARVWSVSVALAVAAALVVCRGACWIVHADLSLDSDEAITGLMAKHLVEGRAFPLFYYGQGYLLGIESWLAAPVFVLAGASAVTLRATVVAMNLVLASGLVLALVRSAGLGPWAALLAASFVLVPAPSASGLLMHASGMSIEPFIVVLVMWFARRRPSVFGLAFALGFMNREFVAYGLVSLLAIELADGTLFQREALRSRFASLVVSAAAWDLVQRLRLFSSTVGPGSPPDLVLASTTSLTQALDFVTVAPSRVSSDVWALLTIQLPRLFGARGGGALPAGEALGTWERLPGSWFFLAGVLSLALVVAAGGLVADRRQLRTERVQFPIYLLLVGVASALGYALLRAGATDPASVRYALLSLFAPVGIVALFLAVQPAGRLRTVVVAGVAAWAVVCALDDTAVSATWLLRRPVPRRAAVCRDLLAHGVKYGSADYWTAYAVTFVSGERVKLAANDIVRIAEYERLFFGHPEEAIEVRTTACEGCRRVSDVWIAPVKP